MNQVEILDLKENKAHLDDGDVRALWHNYLMQRTWLQDNNGEEIYEWDICKISFMIDDVEDHIYIWLSEKEKETQSRMFTVDSPIFNNQIELNVDDIEVIGNIYEDAWFLD